MMRIAAKTVAIAMLASCFCVAWLCHDQRFIAGVKSRIVKVFETTYHAKIEGEITSLSPLFLSLTLEHVSVNPLDQKEGWHWQAQKVVASISVLSYLWHRYFGFSLYLKDCKAFTQLHGSQVSIGKHLGKFFIQNKDGLPILLQTMTIAQGSVECLDLEKGIALNAKWNTKAHGSSSTVKSHTVLTDGSIFLQGKEYISAIAGKLTIDASFVSPLQAQVDMTFLLKDLTHAQGFCFLSGGWDGKEGLFSCHNQDRSLYISPLFFSIVKEGVYVKTEGEVLLEYILKVLVPAYTKHTEGMCTFSCAGSLPGVLNGTVALQKARVEGYAIDLLETSFVIKDQALRGLATLQKDDWTLAARWDFYKDTLEFDMNNKTDIALLGRSWVIPEYALFARGKITTALQGQVYSSIAGIQDKTESKISCEGLARCAGTDCSYMGTVCLQQQIYDVHVATQPFVFTVTEKTPTGLITIFDSSCKDNSFSGTVDYLFLQKIMKDFWDITLVGNGKFLIQGEWDKACGISGSIDFKEGIIRIPHVYNFVHDMHASFKADILKRECVLEKVRIELQKGFVESSEIKVGYDYAAHSLSAHVPVVLTDCFLNWGKDLYALFSGTCVFKKPITGLSTCDAFIILDRAQFKENIFSQKTQKLLTESFSHPLKTHDIQTNISVATRLPLEIKTPQLETRAMIALDAQTGPHKTEVNGTLSIRGGALHFPAHTLSIVNGKLSFSADHTDDPLVELVAQGRIKKYLITLTVGGSVSDPQIILDAMPSLSEEQIIMLLIVGSEEESLNVAAPALVMRNVENIIFGKNYTKYSNAWTEQLKRIRFIPGFTDQTGRGGFKGSLEIEVSKRLRAVIGQSFSMTEDTTVEIEYLLTDDVSIRGSRDVRGDLGAELEMRFKF